MNTIIKVGTRGSRLALTQTNWIIHELSTKHPNLTFESVIIKTKGDLVTDVSLDKIGDKGLFTREIESQLKEGVIDFAVHSLKDLPSEMDCCFSLSVVPKREDPRDVLILKNKINILDDLPYGARIGTGSKRRLFQLQELRPDIIAIPIRGNVETRIEKIYSENLDGVILAAAGLHRLDLKDQISIYLPIDQMIPAPAQGALALQYRTDDIHIKELLSSIKDEKSDICVRAERSFLKHIEGSCHIPIGCHASIENDTLTLRSVFGDENGHKLYRQHLVGDASSPEQLGEKAANATIQNQYQDTLVSLVGAGPGDPDLITIKAMERIRNCDVIVYDRLASPALLKEVPEHAQKIYVGKAASNHAMSQEDIHATLVKLSRKHRRIVRLKGGDPYVFGRGGEEALVLKEHQIPFEIIPGITSSIAGLAYAGIPITHRGIASSFHVFTGHHQSDEHQLDFKTLSKLEGTMVFLMSLSSYKDICFQLMQHGKSAQTPVALISNATTGQQVIKTATLETIHELENVPSPAFLAVGEVLKLRPELNWYEELPLFGKRIIVTRTKHQSSTFSQKLRQLGAIPLEVPSIERVDKPMIYDVEFPEKLRQYTHLWFTSEHAVKLFFSKLQLHHLDTRSLGHLKILSIGSMTTKSLKTYGIVPDFEPKEFTQEGIVTLIKQHLSANDYVLIPSAEDARVYLKEEISKICRVTSEILYQTVLSTDNSNHIDELIEKADFITFTSASSAYNFSKILKEKSLVLPGSVKCVSIGPITSQALEEVGLSPDITASTHTIEGIIHAVIEHGKALVV